MALGLHRDAAAVPVADRRRPADQRLQRLRAAGFEETAATLESFPSDAAFDLIDDLGVRYVVLRTGIPNGLTASQAEGVDRDGVGVYSDAHARAIVDALPPDRVAHVDQYGDAWLIELR